MRATFAGTGADGRAGGERGCCCCPLMPTSPCGNREEESEGTQLQDMDYVAGRQLRVEGFPEPSVEQLSGVRCAGASHLVVAGTSRPGQRKLGG